MDVSASMTAQPCQSVHMLSSPFKPAPVVPGSAQPRRPSNAFTSRRPKTSRARISAPLQALFGTKQASAGKEQYLCIDCGYIYDGRVPFAELGKDYRCPVCNSPKRRFKAQPRAQNSGKSKGSGKQLQPRAASGEGIGSDDTSKFVAGGVGILVIVGAVYAYLNSQF